MSAYFSSRYSTIVKGAVFVALVLAASPAQALQPLSEFLAGARVASVDNREAAMNAVEQREEALLALSRDLPALSVRGAFTHNQIQAIFAFPVTAGAPPEQLVIQPYNQWDLFVQGDAPIIDFAGWARARAAHHGFRSAQKSAQATLLEVEKQVARYYYTLVGSQALQRSAERTLQAAQANADLTRERRAGGIATELDVARAQAEVERDRQNIADAELQSQLAQRALLTLTGVTAAGEAQPVEDDLHPETPLENWERTNDGAIPTLAAAAEQTRSARLTQRAAQLGFLPTLSAQFVERITNAPSFFGTNYYTLTLNLNWRLDVGTIATLKMAQAQAQLAGLRQERQRLAVHDQIYEAWQRIRTGIIKSQAARSQSQAADLAAQFATERYADGAGTQLDLVQAQRDAFTAHVGRIQADADLALARAMLRLISGAALDKDPLK